MSAFATAVTPRADGMTPLSALTVLWLDQNNITDEGVTSISEALYFGALPLISMLNLNNNQISNMGVTALGVLLASAPAHLFVDMNQIWLHGSRLDSNGSAMLALEEAAVARGIQIHT